MAPTKVFVGNLSFKTGEAELAQEFAAAGKVLSANIISRGPRSLGYGFVELESEEEANNAVQLLNKKDIDGRQINVEVARPRTERPEGEAPRRGSFRGRGRGSGRGRGRGRGSGSGRGRGRGGSRGRGGASQSGDQQGQESEQTGSGAETGQRRRGSGRGRGRGGRGRGAGGSGGAGAGGSGAPSGTGRGRGGFRRAEDATPREESETTLFVANLPFSVTDEQLKSEFTGDGHSVKAAHVVTRVTGRSKGYGFVEYETKQEQLSALTAFEHKVIDGRDLIVKIALKDNRPINGGSDDQAQQQGQQ